PAVPPIAAIAAGEAGGPVTAGSSGSADTARAPGTALGDVMVERVVIDVDCARGDEQAAALAETAVAARAAGAPGAADAPRAAQGHVRGELILVEIDHMGRRDEHPAAHADAAVAPGAAGPRGGRAIRPITSLAADGLVPREDRMVDLHVEAGEIHPAAHRIAARAPGAARGPGSAHRPDGQVVCDD